MISWSILARPERRRVPRVSAKHGEALASLLAVSLKLTSRLALDVEAFKPLTKRSSDLNAKAIRRHQTRRSRDALFGMADVNLAQLQHFFFSTTHKLSYDSNEYLLFD